MFRANFSHWLTDYCTDDRRYADDARLTLPTEDHKHTYSYINEFLSSLLLIDNLYWLYWMILVFDGWRNCHYYREYSLGGRLVGWRGYFLVNHRQLTLFRLFNVSLGFAKTFLWVPSVMAWAVVSSSSGGDDDELEKYFVKLFGGNILPWHLSDVFRGQRVMYTFLSIFIFH